MTKTATPAAEHTLDEAAERLRAAVSAEAYQEVPELLIEHNRRFEKALRRADGDSAEMSRLAVEARELLDWVKASVLANRAHSEANLDRLNNAARYTPTGPAARTWKFEA